MLREYVLLILHLPTNLDGAYAMLTGMKAGDNTLNCHCALHLMKTLRGCDGSMTDDDVAKKLFVDYVTFMTTPGSHPDTYSEGFHRFVIQ